MEIRDTCDLESECWLTNFVVRVTILIQSISNSCYMMPVYNKTVPGCDKHRFTPYW